LALLAIGIGLSIVIIAVCGYVFEWEWTGLTKPKQRTFWDWLSLLLVPIVLALGGYLFTRSENRRAQEIGDQQRTLDREIADERRQDDMLQAYLDGLSQLLTDEKRPLHRAPVGDSLRAVARARTLTVLTRLNADRKARVVEFLYESGLIAKDRPILDLRGANLSGAALYRAIPGKADLSRASPLSGAAYLDAADLSEADLQYANLSGADLRGTDLSGAILRGTNLRGTDLSGAILSGAILSGAIGWTEGQLAAAQLLTGATMPDGQKYEDWRKSKGRGEAGENRSP
jgi:uncharacterized protein YjbI with pentapeptide repeats